MPANDDVKCGAVGAVFSVRSEAVSRSVIFGGGLGWWGVLGGSSDLEAIDSVHSRERRGAVVSGTHV